MAFGEFTARGGGTVVREIDADEVRRAVKILADPALSFQVQGLKSGRYEILRGDNEFQTERVAKKFSNDQGVYYSINPCPAGHEAAITAPDMVYRRWLLFDVDPVRPVTGMNATDEEKEDARYVCSKIRVYLHSLGWPPPLVIDSGNGWHLLYRVHLPNDDASRSLAESILDAVASRCDTDKAKVDRGVFNANRIAKLPGTWAKKGPHSDDRPHRMARLVEVPSNPTIVTRELLQKVTPAEILPAAPPNKLPSVSTDTPDPFTVTAGTEGAYLKAALENAAENIRTAVPGDQGGEGRNNVLNREAHSLGGLLGEGRLDEDEVRDRLAEAARDAGLDDREIERTLDSGIKSGKKKPREKKPKVEKEEEPKEPPPPPVIWKMPDLLAATLPPPNWAVDNLLSEGLTILAGKPKLGKSWVALNLALTIAAGGDALGYTKVNAGDVLYLSLEDRLRRVQDRARKVLSGMTFPASPRLFVAVDWPRQDNGGLPQLQKWLESVPRPTLVIVDVWAKFRPVAKTNRSAYDQDYEHIAGLKKQCESFNASVLLVHHTKKGKAEDAIEEVSGTLGQVGSADGVLVLTRARSETEAELFVTGRDVEEQQLALEFDPKTFVWKLLGAASERTESKLKGAAILILKANAGIVLGTGEIADRMGLKDEQRHYLRTLLGRMTEQGLIEKAGVGRYRWPVEAPDSERFR